MNYNNKPIQPKINLKQKIILIIFGLFLFLILLEVGLCLGRIIFLSLQEYRNRVSIKQRGAYRIMCLGESTTALGGKYSYPSQLEEILNQRNLGIKFSVINKGVLIDTSYILSHLEENLNRYNPDMVITMMGANDGGEYLPSKGISTKQPLQFFKSLRLYKLARLLWLSIIPKAEEKEIHLPILPSPRSIIELKEVSAKQVSAKSYVRSGWCYFIQANYTQAAESFKKALELNPRNSDAYIGLGWCYAYSAPIQAEKFFKKAIDELNPKRVLFLKIWDRYPIMKTKKNLRWLRSRLRRT